MENLFKRAKAFIGLEETDESFDNPQGSRQMDINQVIRTKKDRDFHAISNDFSEVVVYEPRIYEDSLSISGSLRKGKPIIINLKFLEPSEGTRLIDFICGAAYAIDGHMMKIGESIFLFTPSGVQITDASSDKTSINEELSSFESQKEPFFGHR